MAYDHDRQIRRQVIGAVLGIVLAADGSVVDGLEERAEELAFAAFGAAAKQPTLDGGAHVPPFVFINIAHVLILYPGNSNARGSFRLKFSIRSQLSGGIES